MGFLIVLVAMVGSWVPLWFIPFGTGGWFLMGLLAGVLTAYFGSGLVCMQALSDNIGPTYYAWWLVALVLAVGGWGTLIYSIVMLVWRGSGISFDVDVHQT